MKPDAPFLGAGMGSGEIGVIPTLNATTFVAMTQDGKLAEGFEAIYTEMEKVRRYGFTQGEFERAQNDLMRRAERAYANRNDRRNGEFVQTYLNNYSKNTPMPDAETEWQLDSMLIKMINVEAVNGFAQQVILSPQSGDRRHGARKGRHRESDGRGAARHPRESRHLAHVELLVREDRQSAFGHGAHAHLVGLVGRGLHDSRSCSPSARKSPTPKSRRMRTTPSRSR